MKSEIFGFGFLNIFSVIGICYLVCEVTASPVDAVGSKWIWRQEKKFSSDFEIKWDDSDPNWITMEMSGPGSGYIAVGFSASGAMNGSDMVMGWVDKDGKPHLKDLYGVGNTMPEVDAENNYELLSGEETDGKTVIRFRREMDTCDSQDFVLDDNTLRLLWAHGGQDPTYDENGTFVAPYHASNRGFSSIYLKSHLKIFPLENEAGEFLDPNIKAWDVRLENNTINGEPTVYYCKLIKLPKMEGKHHLIGVQPLVYDHIAKHLHHMVFFECKLPPHMGKSQDYFEKYVNERGERCFPDLPPEWTFHCLTFVWTAQTEGNMLPVEIGIPLGEEHDGGTYFMYEVHYDNPDRLTFWDNTGVRIFYTDKLRENDAGIMVTGQRVSRFHIIPPKMETYSAFSFCSTECTAKGLPEEGVTVTHTLLHAHQSTRNMRLSHIRNGIELQPLTKDENFDNVFQQTRAVVPSRKFLPGDELMLECGYETKARVNVTYAGLESDNEMCLAFVYYYPRAPLAECKSQPEYYSFLDAVGVTELKGDFALNFLNVPYSPFSPRSRRLFDVYDPVDDVLQVENITDLMRVSNIFNDLTILNPTEASGITLGKYLNEYPWGDNNGKLGKDVQNKLTNGAYYAHCSKERRRTIPLRHFISGLPKIYKKYEHIPTKICQEKGNSIINFIEKHNETEAN